MWYNEQKFSLNKQYASENSLVSHPNHANSDYVTMFSKQKYLITFILLV